MAMKDKMAQMAVLLINKEDSTPGMQSFRFGFETHFLLGLLRLRMWQAADGTWHNPQMPWDYDKRKPDFSSFLLKASHSGGCDRISWIIDLIINKLVCLCAPVRSMDVVAWKQRSADGKLRASYVLWPSLPQKRMIASAVIFPLRQKVAHCWGSAIRLMARRQSLVSSCLIP